MGSQTREAKNSGNYHSTRVPRGEAHLLGLAWAQVAATQEMEEELVASTDVGE